MSGEFNPASDSSHEDYVRALEVISEVTDATHKKMLDEDIAQLNEDIETAILFDEIKEVKTVLPSVIRLLAEADSITKTTTPDSIVEAAEEITHVDAGASSTGDEAEAFLENYALGEEIGREAEDFLQRTLRLRRSYSSSIFLDHDAFGRAFQRKPTRRQRQFPIYVRKNCVNGIEIIAEASTNAEVKPFKTYGSWSEARPKRPNDIEIKDLVPGTRVVVYNDKLEDKEKHAKHEIVTSDPYVVENELGKEVLVVSAQRVESHAKASWTKESDKYSRAVPLSSWGITPNRAGLYRTTVYAEKYTDPNSSKK